MNQLDFFLVFNDLFIFLIFLIFSKEFDSVLDGIVYAGIAALGRPSNAGRWTRVAPASSRASTARRPAEREWTLNGRSSSIASAARSSPAAAGLRPR